MRQRFVTTQASRPAKIAINSFRRRLLAWSQHEGRTFPWRHERATNYQRVISEVLLQRTRAEVVGAVFPEFVRQFSSWRALASAHPKQLQAFLRPLGLWRRRAASIAKLSRAVLSRRGRFPTTREELETMPAVGQYVASAVLLFCHGRPEPLIDSNMARVLERYFGSRKLAD